MMMKMNMNINMSMDDDDDDNNNNDDDEDDGNGRWMTFTRGDDQEVLTDALHLGMCRLEDSWFAAAVKVGVPLERNSTQHLKGRHPQKPYLFQASFFWGWDG